MPTVLAKEVVGRAVLDMIHDCKVTSVVGISATCKYGHIVVGMVRFMHTLEIRFWDKVQIITSLYL